MKKKLSTKTKTSSPKYRCIYSYPVNRIKHACVVAVGSFARRCDRRMIIPIAKCIRLNDYGRHDFHFSYFRKKGGAEIDLIVERPRRALVIIEFKSTSSPIDDNVKHLQLLRHDFGDL